MRQSRPDYVLLWGWGVMNSTALKEAQATGYPRDKMYGAWWAGAEPDVRDVGAGAKGYHALALNGSGRDQKVIQDIMKYARQRPGHRSQGRSRLGALHPWRDDPDAGRGPCAVRKSVLARARS